MSSYLDWFFSVVTFSSSLLPPLMRAIAGVTKDAVIVSSFDQRRNTVLKMTH
jgi:hypothetical protein